MTVAVGVAAAAATAATAAAVTAGSPAAGDDKEAEAAPPKLACNGLRKNLQQLLSPQQPQSPPLPLSGRVQNGGQYRNPATRVAHNDLSPGSKPKLV